ncbi:MAG: sigma 54-interacting transcriptional regulator [Halioglobus sp.]
MEIIARETDVALARMLDSYEHPAILVDTGYQILATNDLYRDKFGMIDVSGGPARCYAVSHGYDRPCDQAGENCPLAAATASGKRERVLHVHQTPRGEEHVDVEMLPILNATGELEFFVELLKPVAIAGIGERDVEMLGRSAAFNRMIEYIARVAPDNAAVLLSGESGCGKELAARAIHQASHRSESPMVTLECAGLNEMLFESELFGHVKGAFTGANYTKAGLAEAAHGGTLFLDEVADIPLALQVKLLRLIETGTYRPVGSVEVKHSDFRLICATHKDLAAMVEEGGFRQDLYYRINVFPIRVPSLAERCEDIPMLANAMLKTGAEDRHFHLTESAIDILKRHHYRGNIRELRNILSRATVLTNTNIIDKRVIAECLEITHHRAAQSDGDMSLKAAERRHLQDLMQRCHGDKSSAASLAGISLRSLYRKLNE